MDLRQLRYFVAVAEELHFTRAALRLHLAQSALSTQISGLEREIGALLFVRDRGRVRLTAIGTTLLPEAQRLLAEADRVLTSAQAKAEREANRLSVGCLGPVPGELLRRVLADFDDSRPGVQVDLHAYDFARIHASLMEAYVDVAFLYLPYDDDELAELDVVPLQEQPRTVVMASSHPLASRAEVTPDDLRDETFVSHSGAVSQTWSDFWMLSDQIGRRPHVLRRTADTMEDWLMLIQQGEGIDTCPELISRHYPWPGLRFVPLAGAAPATLAVARRRAADEPLVNAFVQSARRSSKRR